MSRGVEVERLEAFLRREVLRRPPIFGGGGRSAAILMFRKLQVPFLFFTRHSLSLSPTPPADMPIPIITQGIVEGLSSIPYSYTILKVLPFILIIAALKYYFGGARNDSERVMHSKVVMVTVCQFPSYLCTPRPFLIFAREAPLELEPASSTSSHPAAPKSSSSPNIPNRTYSSSTISKT